MDDRLFRKARTKPVGQILRAFTDVQAYAVSNADLTQWLFTLFRKMAFFYIFLTESTFLRSFLAEKRADAKTVL